MFWTGKYSGVYHVLHGAISPMIGVGPGDIKLKEVKDGSIICETKDGEDITISCDSVISSTGYLPAPLASAGKRNTYLVGDCDHIGNLRSVVWKAYETAMKI